VSYDATSLVSAVIGGAVVAVVSSFLEMQRLRIGRIDTRAEEAAVSAAKLLAEIEAVSRKESMRAGGWPDLQGTQELEVRLRELGQHILVLPDVRLRERLEFIRRALGETSAFPTYAGMSEHQAVYLLCREGRELLGAYLHGSRYRRAKLPPETDMIKRLRAAIDESDEAVEEYFREQEEDRRRAAEKRAQAEKALDGSEPEQDG
jgi:hypothetical protein